MIRLRQVKLSIDKTESELKNKVSKLLKTNINNIKDMKLVKKSIDARDKNNILYVYELDVECLSEDVILKRIKTKDIFKSISSEYTFPKVKDNNKKIVIIGSGPAGLFCGYVLAENGYKPIIIERGEKIEERVKSVEEFWENNKLNINSNVCFGEGGAGTFSDGKLNTLTKDKEARGKKVFSIFVENGAPEEIVYDSLPHIGTDKLREVVKNIRNKIINMGGEFLFNSLVTDIKISNNKVKSVIINDKEEIKCTDLVLAIGHSAKDTYEMLYKKGLDMESKPFAVGLRVEHPQDMINKSQYGDSYKKLEPASYKLTYNTKKGRGVYSFCMCPGGYVVNSSTEEDGLVINGMSNYKRESLNSNSAIVVTVSKKDFGEDIFDGLKFQRDLEQKAYKLGNGNIPVQLYKDFKEGIISNKFNYEPCIKGKYTFTDLNKLLPDYVSNSIKEALPMFGKKINGFDRDDTIMLGIESRTSSPIKIKRNDKGVSNISGIYPCGEGAGYSGGITTSAIDGIKQAEMIAKN
ncbi:MAG: FAD-dependent oxidoreductase [Bacilli bacterium]|nr:FAD-dependent oxidoreductase [Bacilli bacterium]